MRKISYKCYKNVSPKNNFYEKKEQKEKNTTCEENSYVHVGLQNCKKIKTDYTKH